MTRKDFELIAASLQESKPQEGIEATLQWEQTCTRLANALQNAHARFDRERFLTACGI